MIVRAKLADHTEGKTLCFWCPGCDQSHCVRVVGRGAWEWNDSVEAPTLKPSVLCIYDSADAGKDGAPPARCHSYVTDGKIHFLGDCTHALAGKVVDLPEWPYGDGWHA